MAASLRHCLGLHWAWLPSPRFLRTPGRPQVQNPTPEESHRSQTPVGRSGPGRGPLHRQGPAETPSAQRRWGRASQNIGCRTAILDLQRQDPCLYVQSVGCSPAFDLMRLALLGLDLLKTIPPSFSPISPFWNRNVCKSHHCVLETYNLFRSMGSAEAVCLRINQAPRSLIYLT